MRFVIDETSWRFDGLDSDTCNESLEKMLDLLDDAYEQGHSACYSEDFFYISVWQDKIFYNLYASDSPIIVSRDVQDRIAIIFNRLSKWQDLESSLLPDFNVRIDHGNEEVAPSIAWAHQQTIQNNATAVACVIFPQGRKAGHFAVSANNKIEDLWFVAESKDYCDFFRWLIAETTKKPNEMESFSLSAFPNLDFVPNCFNGIKDMSKPYKDLVHSLVHHLGALSDHGKRIFSDSWALASAEFGSLGVSITDENGNTKKNKDAKMERTIDNIVFWWHCKLEPDRDRIYFCPDKVPEGGRLQVGIFSRHLCT